MKGWPIPNLRTSVLEDDLFLDENEDNDEDDVEIITMDFKKLLKISNFPKKI